MMSGSTVLIGRWFSSIVDWLLGQQALLVPLLLVLALVLTAVLLLASVRRVLLTRDLQRVRAPELLITRGQTLPAPAAGFSLLNLTVANLNGYPVQVLEIAIQAGRREEVEVAGVYEPLGANRQVTVDVELTALPPRDGTVSVYLYATIGLKRRYVLQSRLEWLPDEQRHRVALPEQRIGPVQELASERLEWLRRRSQKQGRRSRGIPVGAPARTSAGSAARRLARQQQPGLADPGTSDFPADF